MGGKGLAVWLVNMVIPYRLGIIMGMTTHHKDKVGKGALPRSAVLV